MVAIEYHVLEFNKHVSKLLRKLRQGGEESNEDDVLFIYMMHVMRAYLICLDPNFLLAIKLQKLTAENGPKLLTQPILMITAQRLTSRHSSQDGTYNSHQLHKSCLIALAKWKVQGKRQGQTRRLDDSRTHQKTTSSSPPRPWMEQRTFTGASITRGGVSTRRRIALSNSRRSPTSQIQNCMKPPSSNASATSNQGPSDLSLQLTISAAIAAFLNDEDIDNGSYSAFPLRTTISSVATTKNTEQQPTLASFDSDSFTILVDNGASRS